MVISNPASCGEKDRKAIPDIQRELRENGIRCSFFMSQYPGYAEELSRRAKQDGFQMVVACGGDGTIHEVVNGIIGTDIILGIIPMGRGRDLAENFGIDRNITSAIRNISRGSSRYIDVVGVNGDRYYLGVGGVGFDSEVNKWVNQGLQFIKGRFVYTIASLMKIPGFKFKSVRVEFDNGSIDGEILLVAFGNTRSYGGGMYITPNAEMDDGLLDICLIEKLSKLKLLYMFHKVFKGTHLQVAGVKSYRSKCIAVSSHTSLDLYGDGEFICKTPFTLEVIPKAIRVVVPLE